MEQKFKIGDVVQSKSGGPKMTVSSIEKITDTSDNFLFNEVHCDWFNNKEENFQTSRFKEETLETWTDPIAFF